MSEQSINKVNEQIENYFFGPAKNFAGIAVDHAEKLANIQIDAANAYTDLGIKQAREALDIRDPQGLQRYLEGQRKVMETVTERVKGDSEKVVSLNQEFVQKAQQIAQDNVKGAQKAAQSNIQSATKSAQDNGEKATKAATQAK